MMLGFPDRLGAGLCDSGPLKQAFALRSGGQLTGLFFELIGQFGHSFFKGASLLSLRRSPSWRWLTAAFDLLPSLGRRRIQNGSACIICAGGLG